MQLTIEKLVYGGNGLARIEQPDGKRKTVFVPLVLPGERVEATVVEERPGFARAQLDGVLEPSAQRTAPPCPYFGECGGCHYQHATYEEQLKQKQEILRETVARIAKIELPEIRTHASPPLQYRNRTRLKIATGGDSTRLVVGYHKLGSHELMPVRECSISSPLINRAIEALCTLATDHDLPKGVAEVELFADNEDRRVLVQFLTEVSFDRESLSRFTAALQHNLPELAGASATRRRVTADEAVAAPELDAASEGNADLIFGRSYLDYVIGEFRYRVSAGSFFQTNRHLTATLLHLVTNGAKGKLAMDLYAGAGLFTLPLGKDFDRVIAVESAATSFADLKSNAPRNAKPVQSTTAAFLVHTRQRPDFVIADPPRAGLGKSVATALAKLGPKALVYVSCDPSTLARDLPAFTSAGYRVTQAELVDLFPQTFHIETVLRMER